MTRIMFTGPHGIGKSATAISLNRKLPDYLYVPSFAGPVAKRMKFDLNKPYTPRALIEYQERVLATFIEGFKATAYVDTIFDRSPLDIAAYLYFGLGPHNPKVPDFVDRCIQATNQYCDILVFPNADLREPMQNKFNRPTGYNRETFALYLVYLTRKTKLDNIIRVPVEHQYDARVNYILEKMDEWKTKKSS